jgi:hypothetical protein
MMLRRYAAVLLLLLSLLQSVVDAFPRDGCQHDYDFKYGRH